MKEINQPVISIIVPVYGVEKYLEKCVESIRCQTYHNIEIILVDDGSPDKCGEICDNYQKIDIRIKVIHKQNGGLSDARNIAIPMAKGEYLTFIDSDDWVSPYYIEHLYKAVSVYQADIGTSWFENVYENKPLYIKPEKELKKNNCLTSEECLKKLLYQDGVETSAWGKLYKREIIEDLRYPVGKLYEDILVTYEAIKRSKRIAVIENIDYYYFQRENSIQNMQFNKKKLDGVENCFCMLKAIFSDFPNLKNAAKCRYFNMVCNIMFQIKDNEHDKEKKALWKEVIKYRKSVLFDFSARKKTRMAALLSYCGYGVMNFVYESIKRKGQSKSV